MIHSSSQRTAKAVMTLTTKLLVGFVSLMLSTLAVAQEDTSNQNVSQNPGVPGHSPERLVRRVLPQAQLLYSNYQSDATTNYVGKQGWGAGALVDLGSDNHLVLETGLLYRELNGGTQDQFGTSNYTADYLSLPLSAKYYFSNQDASSLYIKLGAMGSTLTGSSANHPPGYAGTVSDINDRGFELAGTAGVGFKLALSEGAELFAEGNYSRPTDSLFSNRTGYNAVISATAGLGLEL